MTGDDCLFNSRRRTRETRMARFLVVILVGWSVGATRKSVEKCREYGELVYEEEMSPVLRIGAGSTRTSRCAIVETPLIVGGTKAKPGEFPHMAVLGYGSPLSWQCGGTIISERYILTAAHCLDSPEKGPAVRVRVGLVDLENTGVGVQEKAVAERIKYPDYRPPVRYHDIALLKLSEPLELSAHVRPACLEVESSLRAGPAIACGFGKTSYDDTVGSQDLMKVQLDLIDEGSCKKSFAADLGGRQMPDGLTDGLLCAGVMAGGKDTCQGDSGGPLQRVLAEPYCTYSVVGVTSFGKFCAFKNSPAIYTRVSEYVEWIEGVVWP